MMSTRNFGRQSSSVVTTTLPGRRSWITEASRSEKPRTALTSRPSGALKVLGTPKKALKIRLEPSTRSQSAKTVRFSAMPKSTKTGHKVAVIQHPPVLLDRRATLKRGAELLAEAATEGARLVTFPETWVPGYPEWLW